MTNPVRPPLRHDRRFLRYLLARAQSQLGSAVTDTVVPLIAAVGLGASAAQMSLLIALQSAGQLIARPWGAIRAEGSVRRLRMMRTMEWCRFLTVGAIPLVWWTGHLTMPLLIVATTATAVCTGWFSAYSSPYLVDLVDRRDLTRAGGALGSATTTADVVGPGLAGLLLRAMPMPLVLLIDAASYLLGAALLSRLPGAKPDRTGTDWTGTDWTGADWTGADRTGTDGPRGTRPAHVLRGFAGIFGRPLRAPAAGLAVIATLNGIALTVLPLYATRELAMAPEVFAWLLGAGAVGGIGGALCVGALADRLSSNKRLGLAGAVITLAFCVLPFARPGAAATVAVLCYELLGSFGSVFYVITFMTTVPSAVRPGSLARSMAAAALVPECGILAGALAGGALSEVAGSRTTLFGIAVIAFLSGFMILSRASLKSFRTKGESST
ncbi:hypothetical protein BU197_19110 [Streptomyces sp. CBMA291]|nr:hypothetical protein [Streptomyces sp. CBMA291]MBD0712741.1 hypothetical protein [Streptomyces sp. CBMA370]